MFLRSMAMADKRGVSESENIVSSPSTPVGSLGKGRGQLFGSVRDSENKTSSPGIKANYSPLENTVQEENEEHKPSSMQTAAPPSDMMSVLFQFLQVQQENEERRWKLLLDHEDERRRTELALHERWLQAEESRREREEEERRRNESRIEGLKLAPLKDGDNVDEYLDQFQKIAEIQGWKKETWSSRLLPYLQGTARSLYFALPPEEQTDYDSLRTALMKRFNLTAEGYRQRFRDARKEQGETFEQFLVRLKGYFRKWANLAQKDIEDAEDLKDLIIGEQFMETLSTDLAIRVRERQPANIKEAARAADIVIEAKKSTRKLQASRQLGNSGKGQGDKKVEEPKMGGSESESIKLAKEKGLCFKCKRPGHVKKDCKMTAAICKSPKKPTKEVPVPSLCQSCSQKVFYPRCLVHLNGKEVEALRDTGADTLIVDSRLVSPDELSGQKKCVTLAATGHQELCDTAYVCLQSPFFSGKALALVMENSLVPVIIGNQVELEQGEERAVPVYGLEPEHVGTVETRAMTRKKNVPEKKLTVSRPLIGQIGPEEISRLKRGDHTLENAWENVKTKQHFKVRDGKVHFQKKQDLLYRVYSGSTGTYSQLVVPKSLRDEVLRLAHDSAIGGHMGTKKIRERVWQTFYWPGMCADIRRYCSSCDQCQRATPQGSVKRAPLQKMPLMDEPFRRVAVDLVGPIIPVSERGTTVATVVVKDEPEEVGYTSAEIPLLPLQPEEGPENVKLDPENTGFHQEPRDLCSEFQDVLTDVPLLTTLDECEVSMSTDKPIRTLQYSLPHATRDIIKQEVDMMLKLNVIERAASPYSAPIVLEKKEDKIRFCVDFREINKSVVFDAEPVPDVDFLFATIGNAKVLFPRESDSWKDNVGADYLRISYCYNYD